MGFDDGCNTGLMLGLGIASSVQKAKNIVNPQQQHLTPKAASFEPSLSLALPGETYPQVSAAGNGKEGNGTADVNRKRGHESAGVVGDQYYQVLSNNDYSHRDDQDSPHRDHNNGAVSNSFSSGTRVVKRERDLSSEEIEGERVISSTSRASDEDEDGVNARKKLRLTKEQSALLEECFKHHSTLNPKQKQALARQLNLRPRQVEVWFQNRRARTKLKQTEVDCEFLKKCCETLTDENRRLQKELQELKALKLAQPLYMHMPAATLTMCPSCERVADGNSKGPFPMASKAHCYVPFTNPSAAC